MDHDLKQRIIGAVVITALAAIFLPMLFDEPVDESEQTMSELKIPPVPDIALDPRIKTPPDSIAEVLSPGQDESTGLDSGKLSGTAGTQPVFVRWVIQIGSFSQQENALSLRDRLKKQGFKAFVDVMEIPGKGSLYRVRVGPELDKQHAEALRKKIDGMNQIHSIVVSEQAK